MALEFAVLGPVTAVVDGSPVPLPPGRPQALVTALLLAHGGRVSVDRLVGALWKEPPHSATTNLRTYVSRLRRALGPYRTRLRWAESGYVLAVDPGELDLHRFETAVADALTARRADTPERAADLLADALRLWTGEAAEGIPRVGWLGRCLDALDESRLVAVERYAAACTDAGRPRRAVAALRPLLTAHPEREGAWEALIDALARHGDRAAALAACAEAEAALSAEVGRAPGRVLRELGRALLEGEPAVPRTPAAATARAASGPATGEVPVVIPRQLPPDPADFVGRQREVGLLDHLLDVTAGKAGAALLSGAPGVGKTTLATRYAHRVRDRFPDGQLYIDLNGYDSTGRPLTPTEAVSGLLEALGVAHQQVPTDLQAKVGLYRSLLATRRVVLVADNAYDGDQVRPLLPGSPGSFVIITSRDQLTDVVVRDGVRPVAVDELPVDESYELLRARLGSGRVDPEREATEEIIGRCGGLPLALAIVAARAAMHPDFPLAALAKELSDAQTPLDAFAGGGPVADLRTVFSWSYSSLRPPARDLFRALATHPGPDTDELAVASLLGWDPHDVRSALVSLTSAHLIVERHPGRYALHELLRSYAEELAGRTDPEPDRRMARRRLVEHYLVNAHRANELIAPVRGAQIRLPSVAAGIRREPIDCPGDGLAWFDREHEALARVVLLAADDEDHERAADLAWVFGAFLRRRGMWTRWRELQDVAIRCADASGDPVRLAQAHRSLAQLLIQSGNYADARAPLEAALVVLERTDDPVARAHVHQNLAVVFGRQGDLRSAQAQASRAVELHHRAGYELGEANALNVLGWYHAQAGDHHTAMGLCERALSIVTSHADRAGESAALDSLGYIHHGLGDYDSAVACYERAVAVCRDIGDRHSEAVALAHLGDSHAAAHRGEAARSVWNAALVILEELDHPDAPGVRERMAR